MDRLFARVAIAATAVAVLGAVACSSASSTTSSPGGGSGPGDVTATLKDFAIDLAPTTVPAGSVTFAISNEGPSTHEFVIVKTDDEPDALPVKGDEVQEDKVDAVDEQEDIAPSTTATLTAELEAGSYVIMCNLPTHYQQGMHAGITVE